MVDPQILDYVKKSLSSGYNASQLRDALIKTGWPAQAVDDAIKQVQSKPPETKPAEEKKSLGYFARLWKLLLNSDDFFNTVKQEKETSTPVFHFMISLLIYCFFLFLFNIFSINTQLLSRLPSTISATMAPYMTLINIGIYLVSLHMAAINFFSIMVYGLLFALLLHLFVFLFGGRKGLAKTFQSYFYPASLVMLLLYIPVINLFAVFYYFFLLGKCIKRFHEISSLKSFLAIFFFYIAMFAIFALMAFIIYSSLIPLLSSLKILPGQTASLINFKM